MAAKKALTVEARFAKRADGSVFWSTEWMPFAAPEPNEFYSETFVVETPGELVAAAEEWAATLELPAKAANFDNVGWNVSVKRPKRWAPGFKARFDLSGTGSAWIVKREVAVAR